MSSHAAMQSAALLAVFLSTPVYAAPPPGRAWECPISQRLRCTPRARAGSGARPVATIDPNGGNIIPCNNFRGAEGECQAYEARFGPSFVRDELIGTALHGVSLSAVVGPTIGQFSPMSWATRSTSRGGNATRRRRPSLSPPAVVQIPRQHGFSEIGDGHSVHAPGRGGKA